MTEQPQLGWIGWLWFDNSTGATLEQKVQRAARRYAKKHGRQPDVCYVHPDALEAEQPLVLRHCTVRSSTVPKDEGQLNGLAVVPAANVLVNHFWLGVMEGRTDNMDG